MIRVVLDANVWISSVLNAHSSPGTLVDVARDGQFEFIVSSQLTDQVRRHLIRLGFSVGKVSDADVAMKEDAIVVEPQQTITVIAGKDSDNRILECTIEGKADFIVTGDTKHLLPLGTFQGVHIVTPREFLAVLDDVTTEPNQPIESGRCANRPWRPCNANS